MKIYDFDEKFHDYARTWMALHPGLKENQVEESYNEIMRSWLEAPATWLGGETPGRYFDRYDDPKDLMKLLEEYDKRGMDLPEPLYARIVAVGEPCVPRLTHFVRDRERSGGLRASALAMLRDIGSESSRELYIDLIAGARDDEFEAELTDMAGDALMAMKYDAGVVDALLARYDAATPNSKMTILDVCTNYASGDDRVLELCVKCLREDSENRALAAALLGQLGDPRAVEPLRAQLDSVDLNYFTYREIRFAIEELGEDAGPERDFSGDPDYEALRNL